LDIKEQILTKYHHSPKLQQALLDVSSGRSHVFFDNCQGSLPGILSSAIHRFQLRDSLQLFILSSKDEAAYMYDTLVTFCGEASILFFPDSFKAPGNFQRFDQNNVLSRTEIVSLLEKPLKQKIIVSYTEAVFEKISKAATINSHRINITTGEMLDQDFVIEMLHEYGFQRVDFVYEPGHFAIRGSIIDIFSYSNELPYRIQLDGDIIEKIKIFDPESQLSNRNVSQLSLLPSTNKLLESEKINLLEALPADSLLWIQDADMLQIDFEKCAGNIENLRNSAYQIEGEELMNYISADNFIDPNLIFRHINEFSCFHLTKTQNLTTKNTIKFNILPHPQINKHFKLLIGHLETSNKKGISVYFFSESNKQINRLESIFSDLDSELMFQPVIGSVNEGFIDEDVKIEILTDHQVFQRYHKYSLRKGFTRDHAVTLKLLQELQPGDFVTHIDYGVGRFSGLETLDVNGIKQDSVRIFYKNNDILYVSVNSLHKLSRYIGREGDAPVLSKLGSDTWKQLKQRTKKKVKDIAAELIKLYALRKASQGFAFAPDSYEQTELEASFMYEDTPDQATATQDVKDDMEQPYPMDRLICGDVGFGKTEVAIRAAFKAINDGKQVAVLVPTTILALQHYKTFKSRLENFGVEIDYLNRFKSAKEKKEIYSNIKSGQLDLVIGTHALLNKEIEFKDIGLLIVDEEQKFGVSAKEKIRGIKSNVDTLTLTATPIPRTLQFSLMAARDLSMMRTPPPNMQPIHTEIRLFDYQFIVDGIRHELARGGQIFFVHDRIKNLDEIASILEKWIPDASILTAHGQMDSKILEERLLKFINGEIDVLVCTNIIETGLDISNANTIFINNAQHYGLSDLHQLRGRVGRSNRKAYCYLLAPPMSTLNNESRKRLKTIVEFSGLGSGFEIAMRDLDHRGAGNLLGAEQSGFIAEIGYDTFQKILEEAVLELKEEDFHDLFSNPTKEKVVESRDVTIETDTEMLIPAEYVSSSAERLALYHELDQINIEADLQIFLIKLEDRFGTIPAPVFELTDGLRLRWTLRRLGFERLVIKNGSANAYFPANAQSVYYETPTFQQIMAHIAQSQDENLTLKKTSRNLIMHCENISTLQVALQYFHQLLSIIRPESQD
jgi:transcription-repair coupling factor (superfamily II helicase)